MKRAGLRTRVTASFATGALAISACVALVSYDLTRRTLLAGRERSAIRSAVFDANITRTGLATDNPDVIDVLRSLDTGTNRRAVIYRAGRWYALRADTGITAAIPAVLQDLVRAGEPAVQRVRTDSGVALVIGVPLPDDTQFYVVDLFTELDHTLRVLSLILAVVAAGTTAAGAALGRYASRRVLRPLTVVADAARHISDGDLTARLDTATGPELERLTDSFNTMVDKLASRLERDRRFAADVSHELRSPLQTLAAAAAVLDRRRDQLDPRTGSAVDLITAEISRFEDLVSDLLELARGDQPAELAPTDLAALARQVCHSRGVPTGIVRPVPVTDPPWLVDRRRFEQILANLLDNAQRHGGGAVAVRVATSENQHTLDVDDEGPGVPPDDRTAIFDRFVRGRGANARGAADGTGLGLALVAQHAASHGGQVFVTDRPGGGARFTVVIPLRPLTIAPGQRAAGATGADRRSVDLITGGPGGEQ